MWVVSEVNGRLGVRRFMLHITSWESNHTPPECTPLVQLKRLGQTFLNFYQMSSYALS
jgi:hypothetical protein